MAQSTIDTTSRNSSLEALNVVLTQGTGTNPTYEFGNAGFTSTYLIFNLNPTAPFNTAGTTNPGEAELTGAPIAATGAGAGTATHYQIKDRNGVVRRSGTLDASFAVTNGTSYNLTANAVQPAS